ncbi:MAG: hypothetical protein IT341_09385 [Chloroflexi bacterium]|nr:hypothetical protein [Chloroflexota bacterium]
MTAQIASRDHSRLTRITITLPSSLVKAMDETVGRRGRSRFAAEAIASHLVRVTQARAVRGSHATLAGAEDRPDTLTLVEWIEAMRRPRE